MTRNERNLLGLLLKFWEILKTTQMTQYITEENIGTKIGVRNCLKTTQKSLKSGTSESS